MQKLRFGEVLINANKLDWRMALYLPRDKNIWNLEATAIIADPQEFQEFDEYENPIAMNKIDYEEIILCDELNGILQNLKNNEVEISEEKMLESFLYYFENEEYIA